MLIQSALDEIRCGRITVIIAHRFSTLRKADHIIVIDDGQITGQGSHAELIASNTAYQRLYRRLWEKSPSSFAQCKSSSIAIHTHPAR